MYKIIKDGVLLAMTEAPNYIKRQENGCNVLCDATEAQGIAYGGKAYHIMGRPELPEAEAIRLEETDTGAELVKATEASGIMFVALAETGTIDYVTAAEHADLFAAWAYPVSYTAGQIRRYVDGKLYKCLTTHTSQADWTPDAAPSLWVSVSDPAEEWPEWSQPVGSTDAYAAGAKVTHNKKHWISDVDANVWEPGVYGWTEAAKDAAEV